MAGIRVVVISLCVMITGCQQPRTDTAKRSDPEFDKLTAEYETVEREWSAKVQELVPKDSKPDFAAMMNMPVHPAGKFMPKFRTYAESHAGKVEAVPALTWMVQHGMMARGMFSFGSPKESDALWAFDRLSENHLTDPAIREVLDRKLRMTVMDDSKVLAFCEKVRAENPDQETKANAMLLMAEIQYEGPMMMLPFFRADEQKREEERKRGEELFRAIVSDYSKTDAAEKARQYLYEAEHLQIGMKAVEIVGENAEGKPIKLSDFKGQVVVLDFWGFW